MSIKDIYISLLKRLKLRFKHPSIESEYHVLMQPFNHDNFTSFLILLMAGQLGFLAVKVLEGDTAFVVLIGITVIINIFLFLKRKKLHKALEVIVMVFMAFLYALGIFDLKERVEKPEGESSRLFIFFEGYLLALVHQLFLRYFVEYSFLFFFDIGAIILRCVIFGPLMAKGAFPFPVLISIGFDLAILHVCYRKEVTDRGLFEQLHNQKEELKKFKSLMVDSMPENIVIMNTALKKELFINKAFRKHIRNGNPVGDFEQDLRKIYILKESLETIHHTPDLEELVIKGPHLLTLFEFLEMGMKCTTFEEGVFIVQAASTPPDPEKIPIGRRTYEIKIFSLFWDGEDALTVILNDITHREMLAALKVSDMNKDKVLSSVTHELKTPLNGIQGMIQIMQRTTNNPETLFHLNICRSSADLLLHYINSIWDLQLLRKNKLKLKFNKIDIRELLSNIHDLFLYQCQQKEIDLVFDISETIPSMIYTDKDRISEILVHLISNAVKFTFKGSVTLEVNTDPDNKDMMTFAITDTGVGMSEKDRVNLFKMYGRLDSNMISTRGVGLGLTTSNGLVTKFNGDRLDKGIACQSELSKGSKFTFSVPLDITERPERSGNKLSRKPTQGTPRHGDDDHKVTIMINNTENYRTTEGELMRARRTEEPRYSEEDEDEEQMEDDEDNFEELRDIGDVGEELMLAGELPQYLASNGLSAIQENIQRYKTKTIENLCKWSDSESNRLSLFDEAPMSQRSLIKAPMVFPVENSPLGGGGRGEKNKNHKIARKDTAMTFNPAYVKRFESVDSFLRISTRGALSNANVSPKLHHMPSEAYDAATTSKLLKTLSLGQSIKKYEKTQRAYTCDPIPVDELDFKPKILVVDDNPMNILVASTLVRNVGYQATPAVHGQEAIEIVKETYQHEKIGYKLILMDLQMPVMDGFEATRRLIEMMRNREIPTIPIVALTANADDENMEKCRECGMHSCLSKPLKASVLEKLLKTFEDPRDEESNL